MTVVSQILSNVARWFYWTVLLAYLMLISPFVIGYALLFDDEEEWRT